MTNNWYKLKNKADSNGYIGINLLLTSRVMPNTSGGLLITCAGVDYVVTDLTDIIFFTNLVNGVNQAEAEVATPVSETKIQNNQTKWQTKK